MIGSGGVLHIMHSFFQDINKNGSGGVFEVECFDLDIQCCYFHNITTTSFGGCLYANDSHLFLKNTIFESCYITVQQDELLGNVLYIDNKLALNEKVGISRIDQVSHTKCGETMECGDSAICFDNIQYHLTNINSSFNSGHMGSALFSGYNSISDSYLKYSQDSNSTSYISLVTVYKSYDCCFCNFINTENLQFGILWYSSDDLTPLHSCIFYNSHKTLSSYNITLVDCQSDELFDGISSELTTSPQLHEIGAIDNCPPMFHSIRKGLVMFPIINSMLYIFVMI